MSEIKLGGPCNPVANMNEPEGLRTSTMVNTVRKGLNEAMAESIKYGNKVASDEDAAFRAKVIADKKAKVLPMNKEHLVAWREAMKPVWQKFEGEIGKDLIDAAVKSNK